MPTKLPITIIPQIFDVNSALLPTSTIGKIESTNYSSVIRNPGAEVRWPDEHRAWTPEMLKRGRLGTCHTHIVC